MAIALSHRLLCIYSLQASTLSKPKPFNRNPNCSVRFRNVPKSSPQKNADTSLESPSQKLESPSSSKVVESSNSKTPSNSFSLLLRGLGNGLKLDELGLDILAIALPAALALAADPITSLVDTAFVGHLGSAELAGVGVSISVFNLVSKLFNVPLLNITTSFVAEEQALIKKGDNPNPVDYDCTGKPQSKKLLPSASTSLALAASFGIAEAVALSFGSSIFMNIMGIPTDSPMWGPAEQFLTLRALGSPAVVVALAAQGTFRGFMDTKTPLYAVGIGNLLNAILDPILIFPFGLGVGGAAVATVISEYLIAFILLWKLSGKVLLIPPKFDGRKITSYLQSGVLLIGRSFAALITMTLSTSLAC
ncbi:Protein DETOXIFICATION [Quillaja saponaria]|uniref:Protein DETOXIFICATION n=1 Tax=Quillaja saponaria TaxID=32244 RepID=A0AAD7L200_QUISA|nr:Protein DETOXIFICATION [Quillaja saponaria]